MPEAERTGDDADLESVDDSVDLDLRRIVPKLKPPVYVTPFRLN